MKHLYFLSFLIVCCTVARAQVSKGDIIIGGNIGYQDDRSSNGTPPSSYTSHNLYINPSIGKAIRDNLVFGINLSYTHGSDGSVNGGQTEYSQTDNGFQAGVFLRRYKPLGNGFYLFGQAGTGFTYSHSDSENPSSTEPSAKSDGYTVSLQLYPGIAYALNRHWQIETSLPNFFVVNYSYTRQTTAYTGQPDQSSTSHFLNINSSLTGNNEFTVGVRYFIGSF